MKKKSMTLSQFINDGIEKLGVDEFKFQFGVTESCVRYWERGQALPRPHHMEKIVKLSGGRVTYEHIVTHFLRLQKKIKSSNKTRS